MNETKNPHDTDLVRLSRIKTLSWLSTSELTLLAGMLAVANFGRHQIILREAELALTSESRILLSGIARVTCLNARKERVTVALVAPGPIAEFPALPLSQFDFRCEAYKDCRVGRLSRTEFDRITANSSESASTKIHANDLKQWYRLLLRGSSYLNLALHQRVALTLLELCSDFGVEESRGMLLRESFSHKDIAELVGASRPRVTEHLAQLEKDQLLIRQGRQLIVCVGKLTDSISQSAA